MVFRKKLSLPKPFFLGLIIVILAALSISWPLLKPGFFFMHDDVQVMRLYQMEKCFRDGQIPCRWVPDMGAGYGHPLYNYHPVFAYYLGVLFRPLGLSYIFISKLLFLLTYLFSGIFMYLLIQAIFSPLAGTLAAIFFLFAPYHAVDVYVRGAMTESWGIVFFPAIFLCLYQLAVQPQRLRYFVLSVLSLTGLYLSHNIMTLLFTPIALVWALYWFMINRHSRHLPRLLLVLLLSIGLSSFFLLPAFFEQSLVKIDTLTSDYYNFHYHFATVKQLFIDRFWGYGPSQPGPEDKMSFQLGWPQWWIAALALFYPLIYYLKRQKKFLLFSLFASFLYLFSIFMTHAKSVFIWDRLTLLSFVQFPWRFLALAMFAGSLLTAALVNLLPSRLRLPLAISLAVSIIALNFGYFKPERFYPHMTDKLKLSGEEYRIQSMATILDYMPATVSEFPKLLAPDSPELVAGTAQISQYRRRSNFWRFTVENTTLEPATVRVPVFDFPRWLVLLNQQPIIFNHANPLGLIQLQIPPGKYTVVGRFTNTPLRSFANALTLITFVTLITYTIVSANRRHEA